MVWYVIDGMDGSGKSSSSDYIASVLKSRGRKVLEITHPNTRCLFGRLTAKYLCVHGKIANALSTVAYIMDVLHSLNIRKWHGKEYDDVIFVRYSMAAAYLPESLCPAAYRIIDSVLPRPDVRIFIDIDPEVAMERILERGEELESFESVEKLEKARKNMNSIADGWYRVDNSGSYESTEKQILDVLEKVGRSPAD